MLKTKDLKKAKVAKIYCKVESFSVSVFCGTERGGRALCHKRKNPAWWMWDRLQQSGFVVFHQNDLLFSVNMICLVFVEHPFPRFFWARRKIFGKSICREEKIQDRAVGEPEMSTWKAFDFFWKKRSSLLLLLLLLVLLLYRGNFDSVKNHTA